MKTKMLAIAILSLSFFALVNFASAVPAYSGGSGTADDPYEINSVANLMFLAGQPDDYNKCFILTANIDLAGEPFATAIIAPDTNNTSVTFDGNAFTGVFDGNGHTINNLTIDTNGAGNCYLGLFGQISGGQVKNLGLKDISILTGDSSAYVGGLVGNDVAGTINNCYSGGIVCGSTNCDSLGGLIGRDLSGHIYNCRSACRVSGGNSTSSIGGLMGSQGSGAISNCFATGNIGVNNDSDYVSQLGGLAGEITSGTVSNCWASGNITGGNAGVYDLGGLLGFNSATLSNCFATGSVSSGNKSYYCGGLTGREAGNVSGCWASGSVTVESNSIYVSGFAAEHEGGTISDCYSTSAVTCGDYSNKIGGLTGFNDGGHDITNCYSAGSIAQVITSEYRNGTYNGFYYVLYRVGGSANMTLGSAGNFAIQWSGVSDVVAGKGWNPGSASRNISFNCGAVAGNFMGVYGWMTSPLTEYYVTEKGYNYAGYNMGSVTSDGSSYTVYHHQQVSQPSIEGTATFWQNIDIRRSQRTSGTITMANHFNSWSSKGMDLGSQNLQILGVEAYGGGSGYANCTVWDACSGNSATNDANIGGLVGDYNSGAINHCYYINTEPNNGVGTALTSAQMTQQASFTGWDFPNTWFMAGKGTYPKLYWQIIPAKCTATAGTKPNSGKISCSGILDAAVVDFNDANDCNMIKVAVCSDYLVLPCEYNFPVDTNTFKKGKYNYSKTVNGVKKSFTYDVKTHKFAFSASNLDLTGLSCPAVAKIDMGDYNSIGYLDETIVNGPKTPLPIKFMMGVENTLRVDKFNLKKGSMPNSDQLTASGGFAVENPDVNMADCNLVVTLDEQHFTIPAHSLKAGTKKFSCSNVKITDPCATVAATFNYNLASFTLTIKDANMSTLSSPADFGIAFGDFNEVQPVSW